MDVSWRCDKGMRQVHGVQFGHVSYRELGFRIRSWTKELLVFGHCVLKVFMSHWRAQRAIDDESCYVIVKLCVVLHMDDADNHHKSGSVTSILSGSLVFS